MTVRPVHGLVLGKFYPPHIGHDYLIDTAAAQCDRLSVLVMAARGESLPLADRVAWLAATHAHQPHVTVLGVPCDAPVDFTSPVVWAAQVALIRVALRNAGHPRVDVVFSGEAYGDELASRLGAIHRGVDASRSQVPVSASRVRADLAGCWKYLPAPTRAGLVTRIVVVGAESSGTTTIAEGLAERYRTRGDGWLETICVGEFGREFTQMKLDRVRTAAAARGQPDPDVDELVWAWEDFDLIAAEQTRREERAARSGSPLLVCDTDAFATSVWERRYLGDRARSLQPWATTLLPRRDVYLLTAHQGVDWFDDGLREGDMAMRAAMTDWFAEALTSAGHSWVLLTGSYDQRLELSVTVSDYLLAHRSNFGPAITDASPARSAATP